MNFVKNLTTGGKILLILLVVGLLAGAKFGYEKFFPKKVKESTITTKATGLPPLSYDKNANASFRKLPELNEPADVQAPEVRFLPFGWNGFSGVNYAVGGITTAKGSIAEELGLNIHVGVNNSTSEQLNQLYAFAEDLHAGTANPTKGAHAIILMADAWANYASGINARLKKDFGDEYRAEIVTFVGASFGEDFWAVKPKYAKDARGSVTVTVVRDGDWNIAVIKSQTMGWDINNDLGTYDRKKVNFVAAPNDDYTEAGKMYITGQKVTLKIVENGKYTGKDTTLAVSGVASWFPVDQQIVSQRGGLIKIASTKEYASQMATGIIMIKKWVDENRPIVEKMIEAFGRAGEQIKSHDEALKFASQVNELVFADKEKDATAWYDAFKGYEMHDEDGNTFIIGGSRVFSLADAANYVGIAGGSDKYKVVYETFGNISKEAYPEVLSDFPPYEEVTDFSFLKAVYNKAKKEGTAGSISKTDFAQAQKGKVIGDANYSIEFATGSAVIKAESYKILDKIADQLTIADNAFVEIGGHTDNTGDDASNVELSKARAASVAEYLTKKNPDLGASSKMTSKGFGSGKPVAENTTAEGKARNRRVEIKLFKAEQ